MICVYPADCTDFSTNGNGTILIPLSPFSCEFLDNSFFFSGFAFADIFVSKFNALIFLLEVITLFPNKANCKTVFRLARLI